MGARQTDVFTSVGILPGHCLGGARAVTADRDEGTEAPNNGTWTQRYSQFSATAHLQVELTCRQVILSSQHHHAGGQTNERGWLSEDRQLGP